MSTLDFLEFLEPAWFVGFTDKTHGGSSFPQIITLFIHGHRVFRSPFQILVPRSGSSLPVPDPRSSFQILTLCSGSSLLVPRTGSSLLVPDPRSSFRILAPRSGSSFLVPDITLDLSQNQCYILTLNQLPF